VRVESNDCDDPSGGLEMSYVTVSSCGSGIEVDAEYCILSGCDVAGRIEARGDGLGRIEGCRFTGTANLDFRETEARDSEFAGGLELDAWETLVVERNTVRARFLTADLEVYPDEPRYARGRATIANNVFAAVESAYLWCYIYDGDMEFRNNTVWSGGGMALSWQVAATATRSYACGITSSPAPRRRRLRR
jgi:hypothetical protein